LLIITPQFDSGVPERSATAKRTPRLSARFSMANRSRADIYRSAMAPSFHIAQATEDEMAGNLSERGTRDRARINVNQPDELRHWAQKLGVTEDALRKAVEGSARWLKRFEHRPRNKAP